MGEMLDRAKGKAKQFEGTLTGDKVRETEGRTDQIKGNLKGVANKTKSAAKDIAATVTGAFKRTRKRP
jgi:uncharacterized protein YjbJ (UPF0337 family)